jgi:hypothetical protein
VFTLLAMEAVKTYKTNPHFMLGDTKIPTWTTPLVLVLFVSFLVPNTSFLGHVCGLLFGYGCKVPSLPVKRQKSNLQLRGSRIPQIPRTSREDTALDRRKNESAWKTSTLRISRSKDIRAIRRPSFHQPDSCRNSGRRNSFGIRREHTEIRAMSDTFCNHV